MKKKVKKTVKVNGSTFRFNDVSLSLENDLTCMHCPLGLKVCDGHRSTILCELVKNPRIMKTGNNSFNDFCIVTGDLKPADAVLHDETIEDLLPNPDDILDYIQKTESDEVYNLFKDIKESYKEGQKDIPTDKQKKLIEKIRKIKLEEQLEKLNLLLDNKSVVSIKKDSHENRIQIQVRLK